MACGQSAKAFSTNAILPEFSFVQVFFANAIANEANINKNTIRKLLFLWCVQ